MDNILEKCFICAEETSQPSRNLMQLSTKYSGTLIYKVIERFLEGDLSDNVASLIASVICQECVVRLNDYDAAHTKAIIIQKEFTDLLRKNFTLVGDKIQPEEPMYFKVETDGGSYMDELAELDQIIGEDIVDEESPPGRDTTEPSLIECSDSTVSMKCNTCGVGFASLYEMQQHAHKPARDEFCVEFLDDVESENCGEPEYIDEERLEHHEDKEKTDETSEAPDGRHSEEDIHFEQLDILSDIEEAEEEKSAKLQKVEFLCLNCGQEFSSKAKLKNHVKTLHPEVESKNSWVCNVCGLKVKTKPALASHVAKHSRASNYDCTFCGKKFGQKGALARHVPIHTGERPYQCDQCGKQFIHYSSFHMHQLAHGNIREKKCEICGFMLRSSSHLKRHMRVHSGEKPFECPTCGQKFAQRYNMVAHLKAHQGIYREYSKYYKCPFCVKTFQRKLKLQEHLSREHNTVVDSGLLKPVDRPKKSTSQTVEFFIDCPSEIGSH